MYYLQFHYLCRLIVYVQWGTNQLLETQWRKQESQQYLEVMDYWRYSCSSCGLQKFIMWLSVNLKSKYCICSPQKRLLRLPVRSVTLWWSRYTFYCNNSIIYHNITHALHFNVKMIFRALRLYASISYFLQNYKGNFI